MSASVSVAAVEARNPAASFRREILPIASVENCGKKLPGFTFGRLARALWPKKTPSSIEFYTGAPERTARQYAADESEPKASVLVRVLDSDQGWRALEWIMRDSKQSWWLETVQARECAAAYESKREQLQLPLR